MVIALFVCAALGILSLALGHQIQIAKKANQIRVYPLPLGLVRSARDAPDSVLPELNAAEQALLLEALRQFFRVRLKAGEKKITVPSRAVHSVWVAFSQQTQAYEVFCDRFFGRRFPTEQAFALGSNPHINEGLRRVWTISCRDENINPFDPVRLPLLFAIDRKLNLNAGFHYYVNQTQRLNHPQEPGSDAGPTYYFGTDFSDRSFDGTLDGLGDSSDSGGDGGGDGGGGD